MKAKEILKLYEEEQTLTGEEIFNLIYDYFIKKMKSVGMDILNSGLDVEAHLVIPLTVDYADVKRYSRAYIKKVSKLFGRLFRDYDGGTVNVVHPNPVNNMWVAYPIFYFSSKLHKKSITTVRSDNVHYVELCISFSNPIKYYIKDYRSLELFTKYAEFSTKEGRKEIYELIDSLAKFIRLTPFGK